MRTSTESARGATLRKRFLGGAFAAVLALGLAPGMALAEGGDGGQLAAGVAVQEEEPAATALAQIGDATYDTLQAAVDAAQDGDTITLLADYQMAAENQEAGIVAIASKNIVIDFAGHRIAGIEGQCAPSFSLKSSSVTLKDSAAIPGGEFGWHRQHEHCFVCERPNLLSI